MITKGLIKPFQIWKTVKPFFREKVKTSNITGLTENNKPANENMKICEIFNTYFTNITKGVNLRVAEKDYSLKMRKATD